MDTRKQDPTSIIVFHQADVGEYLRDEDTALLGRSDARRSCSADAAARRKSPTPSVILSDHSPTHKIVLLAPSQSPGHRQSWPN